MSLRHWTLPLALSVVCAAALIASYWQTPPETVVPRMVESATSAASGSPQSLLVAFEPSIGQSTDRLGPPEHDEPHSAEFFPDFTDGTIHADAVDVPIPPQPRKLDPATIPAEFPRVAAAQPIDAPTAAADSELSELLARELEHLDESQRRVWHEVLQGLSPRDAMEILNIWKVTGGPIPQMGSPLVPSPADVIPVPALTRPASPQVELVLENLNHIDTPGYLRREPVGHSLNGSEGSPAPRLDLTPGPVRVTRNPLHVAIEGTGFFTLRRGDVVAYTRNGEFDLSATGELIQRRSDGDWSLDPPVQAPSNAFRLIIDADGQVGVHTSADETSVVPCGRIVLVTFLNPQQLQPLTGDLLTAGEASGETMTSPPGRSGIGSLRQGALELSNATLESERAALDRLEQQGALRRRARELSSPPTAKR